MFSETPKQVSFPRLEQEVLEFWRRRQIYAQSLEQRRQSPRFVFYEGPPTANGMPHPGHCLTRAIKDLFPRYRTMRGYLCERKAGWDTHGLPVEVEVCKELGIHSKEEIESFGVEAFIQRCQKSVWRYMQAWEQLTERLGFWVDLEQAYVTYHQSFVESVWWSLKNLFERDLLYQGYKIVWWWAQGGTALSSGEVGQGYRTVLDPSVYVKCPLADDPQTAFVIWTTTPWTLPSNQFLALHPELSYAVAEVEGSSERWILAADLVSALSEKFKVGLKVLRTMRGAELVGRRYLPPFDYFYARLGAQRGKRRDGSVEHVAWRVISADFVTVESGSGVVHQAPAFGEVDFEVLLSEQATFEPGEGPELLCPVDASGKFTSDVPDYQGRWVKDCDREIIRALKDRGLLLHQEQFEHEYPFCWRAEEDPLIQYPRRSWFIRTTKFREAMLANNSRIGWLPEHIRDGRFGNFLAGNVDWALSRERYWGTPLPIWECERSGYREAIASFQELLAKPGVTGTEVWQRAKAQSPDLPDDLQVHKPYIDAITYDSPKVPGARMRRVPEVIDCWYDAGAMPFAQWGYPHRNRELFQEQFPADFISEALDQTRGWFYGLLAISTLLFSPEEAIPVEGNAGSKTDSKTDPDGRIAVSYPHPFRNCIVLGLMLSEWFESRDGRVFLTTEEAQAAVGNDYRQFVGKMSKMKRNYREPQAIFDNYGADALRWYFFANQAPWTSIRYSERAIRDSVSEFQLRLWNVYSFFVLYANIDGFDPGQEISGRVGQLQAHDLGRGATYRPPQQRSELDRWIMSELQRTIAEVVERMDAYDSFNACASLHEFVDGLSNWYVRRGRDRYWSPDKRAVDKLDAYWTLYECLLAMAKLMAPFMPFLADYLWRGLTSVFAGRAVESVHLCDYPTPQADLIDRELSLRMDIAREICSKGRAARMEQKLKVRQPLSKVEVILTDETHLDWLKAHSPIIADELNVKEVEFTQEADRYIEYQVRPNFKLLGPRVGKLMPAIKTALQVADPRALMDQLSERGQATLRVESGESIDLSAEELQIDIHARPGWAAARGRHCVVVLSTELTPELIREGLARDVIRFIQEQRKAMDCQYTDRIHVGIETQDPQLQMALRENANLIRGETLCVDLRPGPIANVEPVTLELNDQPLTLYVQVA